MIVVGGLLVIVVADGWLVVVVADCWLVLVMADGSLVLDVVDCCGGLWLAGGGSGWCLGIVADGCD